MKISLVNSVACAAIFMWAFWCIFSRRIRDGVVGKVFYIGVALTSLAVVFGPSYGYYDPPPAEQWMNVFMGLVATRYLLLVMVRPWWYRIRRRRLMRRQAK